MTWSYHGGGAPAGSTNPVVDGDLTVSDDVAIGGDETVVGVLSAGSIAGFAVFAPPPSGGDDYAALQAAINLAGAYQLGVGELRLRRGTYLVSQQLRVAYDPAAAVVDRLRIVGAGLNLTDPAVCEIKATAPMTSVLSIERGFTEISGARFNGNSLANYGVLFQGASFCKLSAVGAFQALFDGFHMSEVGVNDTNEFDRCISYNNGTIYITAGITADYRNSLGNGMNGGYGTRGINVTGTATTVTGNLTVNFAGLAANLNTLGIRKGDFLRVGATISGSEYLQIEVVGTNTLTLMGLSTPLVSTTSGNWAIFCGAGYYEMRGADDNINTIIGGKFYTNAASAIVLAGVYGARIYGPQLESSPVAGLVLGYASGENIYATSIIGPYFEGNLVASIWLGCNQGTSILSVMSGDPALTKTGNLDPHLDNMKGLLLQRLTITEVQAFSMFGYKHQSFTLWITNSAGTIRHAIVCDTLSQLAPRQDWDDRVNGATSAFTNTPAVTGIAGFAGGGGISGGSQFLLDTADQIAGGVASDVGRVRGSLQPVRNSTGAVLYPELSFQAANVNGVTRYRPAITLRDGTDAQMNFDTTTIPAGKSLVLRVDAWFR